jgi:predicted O-methyltransferase YrrM
LPNPEGPGITNPEVDSYLICHIPPRDAVLTRLERQAELEHIPIVGPVVGNFLYILARIHHAKQILELGTAIGYSTIWWAKAVQPLGGKVTSVEIDENRYIQAQKNLASAGLIQNVELQLGDVVKILPKIGSGFDIIFIDTDKEVYLDVLRECKKKVRKGGLIVADNCLWSGYVVTRRNNSKVTKIIKEYNETMSKDADFEYTIVPMRDGLGIALKK